MSPSEKKQLLCIVLLAFMLRLFVFLTTPVIGVDGYYFARVARQFSEGQFYEALTDFHPLYPLLISALSSVTGEYEVSGKLVSLFFGTFTVLPLYFLTRSFFDHRAALLSTLFLAINPTHVRLSADIIIEPTYLFFFTTGMWLSWRAVESRHWYFFPLVGTFVLLAYYTRVEGLGILVVVLPWLFLIDRRKLRQELLRRVSLLVLLLLFLIPMAPYIFFIKQLTGMWHITVLPKAYQVIGHKGVNAPIIDEAGVKARILEKGSKPSYVKLAEYKEEGRYHRIMLFILNEYIKTTYIPCTVFILVGLFRFVKPPPIHVNAERFVAAIKGYFSLLMSFLTMIRLRLASVDPRGEFFILGFFLLHFAILYRVATEVFFVSGRYLLPITILSFIWAGTGTLKLSEYIANRFASFSRTSLFSYSKGTNLLIAGLLVLTLPKDFKIKRTSGESLSKEAGQWIRNHNSSKRYPVILGDEITAFYAGGDFVPLEREVNYDSLIKLAKSKNADYLAFYKERFWRVRHETFEKIEEGSDFTFVREWTYTKGDKGRHLRLYRFIGK